ncbi:MAG TPA: response regulator [Puia sp.]|nr:response regulator [Puia sp.]
MTISNSRILIVEDNPDILELYSIMLRHNNYEVLGRDHIAEIKPVIRNYLPQVIILDMLLSGLDGLDICRQIKDDPTTRHIPVVMVSAHSSGLEKSVEVGADFFLAKPFDMAAFLDTISRAIDLRKQYK